MQHHFGCAFHFFPYLTAWHPLQNNAKLLHFVPTPHICSRQTVNRIKVE